MNVATTYKHLCWDDKPLGPSLLRAIFAGALTAALLSLFSGLLFALLGRANMGTLAGAAVLERGGVSIFFAAVVFAPLWETLIAQFVPIGILTVMGVRPLIAVFVSAALFSAGHVLTGGGVGQGLLTFVGGMCCASVFATNLKRGFLRAYGLTAVVHASTNALLLLGSLAFD